MQPTFTIVILAGGKGRRLDGKDKGLISVNGKPLIEYVLLATQDFSGDIVISANRNLEDYKKYGYSVLTDSINNYQGPLAGILTALQTVQTDYILTLPCDSPLITSDYLANMKSCLTDAEDTIIIAHDGKRMQQLHALIPASLTTDLEKYLKEGNRRVDQWYQQHQMRLVDYSATPEQFFNANSKYDIEQITSILQQ